jgi:hypothetical protein
MILLDGTNHFDKIPSSNSKTEKMLITLTNLPMVYLPVATLSKGAGVDVMGH